MPVIEVDAVTRSFEGVRAVSQVSFSVEPGEVVGLLGPNGAGKTTTLRVLAGLLRSDAGRAAINGIDVATRPLEARKHLGFLTASDLSHLGIAGAKVAVYLPHSFAWSGNLYIVPSENVTILDAKAGDVMNFIVSGGVVDVDEQ